MRVGVRDKGKYIEKGLGFPNGLYILGPHFDIFLRYRHLSYINLNFTKFLSSTNIRVITYFLFKF